MNKTGIIARREFITAVRRLSYILLTISFPLLAILGIAIYGGVFLLGEGAPSPVEQQIGYVDDTGLFNGYTTPQGVVFTAYNTSDEAKDALLAGNISEYYYIPQDYLERGAVSRFTTKWELELPKVTIDEVEDFLVANLLSGEVSNEIMTRAQNPLFTVSFRLDKETGEVLPPEDLFATFGLPLIFAFIFMMSLMITSGYLIQGVSEEKENRVMEVLLSSVSARQLLTGKVLGLGAAGLLQIMIWSLFTVVLAAITAIFIPSLSNLTIPPYLIAFSIIYFILGYLLYGILLAALGAMGASARESNQWATIVVLPAMAPLWLIGLFMTNPEHVVFTALTFFPLTAPATVVMRLSAGSIPAWEILLSIAILSASIVAAMWIASRVFRTFILMYGKRPSLREALKYLRHG